MVVAYPSTLPTRAQQDYSETPVDARVIDQIDVGPAKTRLRTTATRSNVSFTWILDTTTRNALQAFHDSTLVNGTLTFSAQDFGGAGTTNTFLFMEPPAYRFVGGSVWQCSLKLMKVS